MTNHDELCEKDKEIKELRTRNAELDQENKKLSESIKDYCEINFGGHEETVKELLKLRTRVAELENISITQDELHDVYTKLPQQRGLVRDLTRALEKRNKENSDLLKASEGMEKALEELVWRIDAEGGHGFDVHGLADKSKQALADFRAVKEHNEIKGGGK